MDASPDVLAEEVRARRVAIDNDLEMLRVRLLQADPRRIDPRPLIRTALPIAGAAAAVWWWARRRRPVDSMHQLLLYGLNDLLRSEQQLVPALERMRVQASTPDLQQAFEIHRDETAGQVSRLLRAFRSVGAKPERRGDSAAVSGIIAASERLLRGKVDADVRDAWLIATAQQIEHLEIATYGTVRTYAETLGFSQTAALLQQSLDEERATDEKLTRLAERFVNPSVSRE